MGFVQAGLYPEDSITRKVNRENVLLLGGGRALLMQLAHPKVAAGSTSTRTSDGDRCTACGGRFG